MIDKQKKLEIAYKYSKLLKINSIREEIEQKLNKYFLQNVEFKNGEWACNYKDENDNHLLLIIALSDNIRLLKLNDNKIERITVNESLLLSHVIVEKREKGLIYSIIEKQYGRFKNQITLNDLIERRYVFTEKNIVELIGDIDLDNKGLMCLLLKLKMLENKGYLKDKSDYNSKFSTHINYNIDKDNNYSTRTYLNEEDISNMYNIEGIDKLYRIFDLYRGIINNRNEKDIKNIRLGLLPQDIFDLKTVRGITAQEELLVGKSLDNISKDLSYDNNSSLNRDQVLSGILYKQQVQNTNEKSDKTSSLGLRKILKFFVNKRKK